VFINGFRREDGSLLGSSAVLSALVSDELLSSSVLFSQTSATPVATM
jgi:hypothetical protein